MLSELIEQLNEKNVALAVRGSELIVRGSERIVDEPALIDVLRRNKDALMALIQSGDYLGPDGIGEVPENRIPIGCSAITPDMLPLMEVTAEEIECIVSAVPGGAGNVQDIYPLAPLQEGMFFHYISGERRDPYLSHVLFSFESRRQMDAYFEAMQSVIHRHDILRTAVLWEGLHEPVQVVWRHAPLKIEDLELHPESGNFAKQLLERFDPSHFRLDIRTAPLIKIVVACDSLSGRWIALALSHHLAIGGATLAVIQEETKAVLEGETRKLPAPVPFRHFVAQARHGARIRLQDAFFKEMLGDVHEPTAPYSLLEISFDGLPIKEEGLHVEPSLARRLRAAARMLHLSTATLFHLSWASVLARVSGRSDVVFGTVLFAGMRDGDGKMRLPGMFINTLPIRISIDGSPVKKRVEDVHGLLTRLMRHEFTSLARAQRCSGVIAPTPLFGALLNYRHNPDRNPLPAAHVAEPDMGTERGGEGIELLGGSAHRTNYPLTLEVDDFGESFHLSAIAQMPIDPERICTYMHTALEHLVQALEQAPMTPIREIEVLPHDEQRCLLVDWNATQADYPQDQCMHQLFEAQAAATPDAVALLHEAQQLSYDELNRRANRLARHLRTLGVVPDARVAICMERSIDMVVAILAVMKAGGAYVPLDPAYPAERLAFMLQDSAPVAVLTHERLPAPVLGTLRLGVTAS
ncbi:condensation domain-containing protein, partial [Noviherbaspirillum sp. Root189]|uniref:condensation domain-containing protein n=1 Tax=Noviherbaspirillum sp. Root189 TaxID=1736487 RepID=UPI001F3B0526